MLRLSSFFILEELTAAKYPRKMYGIPGTVAAGDVLHSMSGKRKTEEERSCLTKYH